MTERNIDKFCPRCGNDFLVEEFDKKHCKWKCPRCKSVWNASVPREEH